MKKTNIILLISFCLIFQTYIYSQNRGVANKPISKLPAKEKRWALIIGVDTYQKDISPLYGTVNDAKALRDVLIKYAGFTDERIILMTTDSNDSDLIPTRGNIIDQMDKLSRVVPEDGLILFSFSGHGVSIGSDAFIVPADGRIYQNADLMRERAIDVLRIKRAIQATRVKQVIMFLDACRNDPVRAKGDVDNNLTTAYTKGFSFETKNQNIEAYATLYATSFGDRAYEFLDKKTSKYRGYFSYAIEEGLKGSAANEKGEITLGSLIGYIENTVKERVHISENQRQIPYPTTEGFRNSDLVIAVVERNIPITTNPISSETASWQRIENSTDARDFENYLSRVNSGEFRGTYKAAAELKLAGLIRPNTPATWARLSSMARMMLKYDDAGSFSEGLAQVSIGVFPNYKWGFIDKTGKEIIPVKYDYAGSFSEGLAQFIIGDDKTGKYGFIDKTGKEIIPAKYDNRFPYSSSFSEGLAQVIIGVFPNYKWGFIDKTGKEITPVKYDDADSFSEGLAKVRIDVDKTGKYGFIDKTGREVISIKYDRIWCYAFIEEGFYGVTLNGRKGFVDIYGNEYFDF